MIDSNTHRTTILPTTKKTVRLLKDVKGVNKENENYVESSMNYYVAKALLRTVENLQFLLVQMNSLSSIGNIKEDKLLPNFQKLVQEAQMQAANLEMTLQEEIEAA